jgi:hypothetical protein
MMKVAVLHVNSSSYESTSPTMRIARYVAKQFNVPLIHDVTTAQAHVNTRFDVLFVKYGLLKFSNHRDEAVLIHEQAKRVINLENDYTFVPDKRFRKADETWSTVEGKTHLINWNVLTRHPIGAWRKPRPFQEPINKGLIYYGAHRADRIPSFKRYFSNPKYPLTVSTFRGGQAFRDYGVQDVIGAFRHPDAQAQWESTIYIEDETSHGTYTSPATRFYECVMCGLAQFIDAASVNTLTKSGIDVLDKFVVQNNKELLSKMQDWRNVRTIQRELWFQDYGRILNQQFDAAVKVSGVFK